MSTTSEQQRILAVLEDTANLLRKTQSNLKKCPKARLTQGYVKARIQTAEDYWTSFKNSHQELVKITPKEQKGLIPYFLNEEFFIYEDLYLSVIGDLRDILSQLSACPEKQSANNSDNSMCGHSNIVQLPKISIPTFGGTYEQWPSFKDLFISLVHNNTLLSEVEKLHYLKSSVTGEAETILKHIQITSDNYAHAWDVLQSRYGNKRLLLNAIMKRLFNQRKINSQSAYQLKALLDTTTDCLNSIKNMQIPTTSWDPIIIHLLSQKLDPETHRSWEEFAYKEESAQLPTWNDMKKFIEQKYRTLELLTSSLKEITKETRPNNKETRIFHISSPTTKRSCIMCKEDHTLSHCKQFSTLSNSERRDFVTTSQLCYNCLAQGHSASHCRLRLSCRICKGRHHSLLHANQQPEVVASTSISNQHPQASHHVADEEEAFQVNTMIASHLTARHPAGIALLATAVVEAKNISGHTIPLRALIDQGSQATFISEKATQLLKLNKQPMRGSVIGVGSTRTNIKHVVHLQIGSRWDTGFSLPIQAFVMPKQLTTKMPTKTITNQQWPHLKDLNLADPTYLTPGSIDLLLGVREYAQILKQGFIKGPPGTPCAQMTSLGWILFGDISTKPQNNSFVVMHHHVDVEDMLKSIWEIDIDTKRHLTTEEKQCEDIYEKTTTRNQEGRYVVHLPFKTPNPISSEGNTKEIATRRFLQLERKFKRSPNLKEEYKKVIEEYRERGYLEEVPEKERETKKAVYLPHHAVVRDDKETSRTRIVFDASCKGTNNVSLNDELWVGPQLQEDLRFLLIRWRMKPVCFMADVQKMYLQILVTQQHIDYQRILWRPEEFEDLKEFRLLRVTFGTASAPYLAVKTLQRIAKDEGSHLPLAAQTIKEDFYMDDLLSGADTAEEAITMAKEIESILLKGGFQLTKWASNNIQFIQSIEENKRSANVHVDMNLDGTIKALGITWNLNTDNFQYNLSLSPVHSITKRSILSDIQKLFDPLGWIAPSTVMAKILIQKLWLEKINWDDHVSEALEEEWREIRSNFDNVHDIKIKRWMGTTAANKNKIQIHGFSDASTRAYAAAVYLKTETIDGRVETNLIAARTRVAPLKTISLPRLELCGALLLSKLMKQIGEAMRIPTSQMYAWTDSEIVIAWLCGEPNRWKSFVANRVVEIVENLNNKHWNHVQSHENPADLASRGVLLSALKDCDLWWKGPRWLSEKEIQISKQEIVETEIEMKTTKINTYLTTDESEITHRSTDEPENKETKLISQFEHFDSLIELLKAIIYCKRFLNSKKNTRAIESDIETKELEEALNICIKRTQEEEFNEEVERLKTKKQVKNRSKLKSLNPYIDEHGILRVGGRLRHTNLPADRKNPIILGNNNELTLLIVADAHKKTMHGGVQLMMSYLRSKYWILKAKSLVKKNIHKCLICARLKAIPKAQLMGDLPKQRVVPARPFLNCGVDFAGPFQTLMCKGRGMKTKKTYVAIFVCLSTKAIHLELVGDLTSEAFVGAFRRFVARRGKCNHIWSDQGRSFLGANKQLVDAWKEAKMQFAGNIAETLATEGTQWHNIPAYSPHMGGLWETGVKSMKHHLKRIITTNLTFEEMTTVLCQIEACLNSRPLCPIDDTDEENLNPITPGHFLLGEAPIVVPSPDTRDVKMSTLSRWQLTQKLVNDFWRRWQDEYLSRLQQRPKWLKTEKEFKIGEIVLIKTENLPPAKWTLGRIVDKHPGDDGITRVYSVKSDGNIVKRPFVKLCALPIDSN